MMLGRGLSFGLEYDYTHLDGELHVNGTFNDANHDVEVGIHAVMARMTFHFNSPQ